MDKVECIVIGAGVIGLAVARATALAGKETIVLEAAGHIGEGTSSRNSEVIHAGIYYPQGSLKARLCVAGKRMLYDYCAQRDIPHRRLGKIIVATSTEQLPELERLQHKAVANGVDDLRRLSGSEMSGLEPEIRGASGLLSPSTGIIDSHALMLSLQGEAEYYGAIIAFHSPFLKAAQAGSGFLVTTGGPDGFQLRCDLLINAAGLAAPAVARAIEGLDPRRVPEAFLAKGNYFGLSGVRTPFRHLIYPVPEAHGLGVHVTLDLSGQARFGPDVEWVSDIDYNVDPARGRAFYASVRRYWPGLPEGALVPAYAGIRPKIADAGSEARDFVIEGEAAHGLPGLVNLFGIESPGLTASLAIAHHVRELLA